MQDIDSIKCPVCLQTFDADKHLPKIFPDCGHTICQDCLIQVLKMSRPKCPLDKLDFSREFQRIEAFPINFLGKNLLAMEGQWSKCHIHDEPNKMVCLTCNKLICANCGIFGDHKGHEIKLWKEVRDAAKQKRDQLQGISDKISKASTDFTKIIEEKKQEIGKKIHERFEDLRWELTKKEFEMMIKVESVLIDEKIRLEEVFNKVSIPSSLNIEERIKEFSDILSSPDIPKLLEQEFSDLEKMIDEKVSASTSKHTEELSELLTILQDAIPREDLLKNFDMIEPLSQQILKFHERFTVPEELTQILIQDVELKITEEVSGVLKIQVSDKLESFTFDKTHLGQIKSLHFEISMSNTINDKTLSSILMFSKHLINVKSVNLHLDFKNYQSQRDHLLGQLLSNIFLIQDVEEIDINVKNLMFGHHGFTFLIEKLLPQYKNLKSFSCSFDHSIQTNRILRIFSKANLSNNPHLEKFHFTLEDIPLSEEDLIQFFSQIPRVKDLKIRFDKTSLTDPVLEYFSTQILPSLDKLERLDLGLSQNRITDVGVQKLFANLPNSITTLDIGLDRNNITITGVQDFVDNKLALLTNLKDLRLGLSNATVFGDLIKKIGQWNQNKIPALNSTE